LSSPESGTVVDESGTVVVDPVCVTVVVVVLGW
jgi:hypothetical protein